MSIVKINAIDVPAERADMMAQRFAARAGEVGKSEGFEEFQLLRPDDDRTTWLVYTRWRDEAAFEAGRAPALPGGPRGRGGGLGGGAGPGLRGGPGWGWGVPRRPAGPGWSGRHR